MFRKNEGGQFGSCSAVTGQITPYGCCDLFDRLDNPYGNRMTKHHEAHIHNVYDHAHGYSVRK